MLPLGDEGVLYPGMLGEPLPDQSALVGAEVVGDQVDKTSRDGPLDLLQQLYVALEFREREVKVSDLPSFTLRAPNTHALSGPRLYSRGAFMRWPSGDHPGAGGKERGVTGPSSSTQTTVEPGGGSV